MKTQNSMVGKNTLAEKTWMKNTQTLMVGKSGRKSHRKNMDEKNTNFDGWKIWHNIKIRWLKNSRKICNFWKPHGACKNENLLQI